MTDQIRYLDAKRTVDDRSLSVRIVDKLRELLPENPHIFEAGCGTGITISRLREWGIDEFSYHGTDTAGPVLDAARERYAPGENGQRIRFERADALDAVTAADPDLIVAQQFVDLVGAERVLDAFLDALAPGGLAYFPLTFDGTTIFQPGHPADPQVLDAYHASMDERPSGDSRAGRHLLAALGQRPGDLSVASSDAIVRPVDGSYPADERFFLERILDFFETELAERSVSGATDWLSTRYNQLDSAKLVYVAHRYDLLYRAPDEP